MMAEKLSCDETIHFLELCEQYPCLWDIRSDLYHDTILRMEACEKIAEQFNIDGFDMVEARRKLALVEHDYKIEISKISESQKSATNGGDVYKPTEPWFAIASKIFSTKDGPLITRKRLSDYSDEYSDKSENDDNASNKENNEVSSVIAVDMPVRRRNENNKAVNGKIIPLIDNKSFTIAANERCELIDAVSSSSGGIPVITRKSERMKLTSVNNLPPESDKYSERKDGTWPAVSVAVTERRSERIKVNSKMSPRHVDSKPKRTKRSSDVISEVSTTVDAIRRKSERIIVKNTLPSPLNSSVKKRKRSEINGGISPSRGRSTPVNVSSPFSLADKPVSGIINKRSKMNKRTSSTADSSVIGRISESPADELVPKRSKCSKINSVTSTTPKVDTPSMVRKKTERARRVSSKIPLVPVNNPVTRRSKVSSDAISARVVVRVTEEKKGGHKMKVKTSKIPLSKTNHSVSRSKVSKTNGNKSSSSIKSAKIRKLEIKKVKSLSSSASKPAIGKNKRSDNNQVIGKKSGQKEVKKKISLTAVGKSTNRRSRHSEINGVKSSLIDRRISEKQQSKKISISKLATERNRRSVLNSKTSLSALDLSATRKSGRIKNNVNDLRNTPKAANKRSQK